MFDLQHGPLARLVAAVGRLCDHAIQPRALELIQPLKRFLPVGGRGGEVDRRAQLRREALELAPALLLRSIHQTLPVYCQKIEGYERGWRLLREFGYPRGRRMEPELQQVEVEPVRGHDHDLSVQYASRRQLLQ